MRGLLLAVFAAAAVSVGVLGVAGRALAERLSQDYVHEIWVGQIRCNLLDDRSMPLGGAVSRTTNDLTVLMNWITRAVAPLVVGIPLIIGVGFVLLLLDPMLAVILLVPILLVPAMRMLAPILFHRARKVRAQRGRLSPQVLARGTMAVASVVAAALLFGSWLFGGISTHSVAGAVTMVGFLVAPIHKLGRVVEQRQAYRVARQVERPAINGRDVPVPARAEVPQPLEVPQPVEVLPRVEVQRVEVQPVAVQRVEGGRVPSAAVRGAVLAAYVELSDGTTMPDLAVRAGARVVVDVGDGGLNSELLERFTALRVGRAAEIVVGGMNLAAAGPEAFRQTVGYVARGIVLSVGTVSATVRYRSPGSESEEVERMLAEVGLAHRVAGLPQGADTVLVRGGEPLTVTERARLLLAGAMLDMPSLLVFDHLDTALGPAGRIMMRSLLADYPGAVILASADPEQIITPTHIWRPDGVHQIALT